MTTTIATREAAAVTEIANAIGGSTKSPHKVWSGALSFGLITAPVVLLTAATEERISFNQLCPTHRGPIKQQLFCEPCAKPIARAELLKGYKTQSGYVIVTEEELDAHAPASAKTLELSAFVPAAEVDALFFESSYYLAPGEGGQKPYALVRRAMIDKQVVGVAKLVRSGKEHVCIIRPYKGGMILQQLFWFDEVRAMAFPALPEANATEVLVAGQLVDALAAEWNPAEYTDSYRQNVMALLNAKMEGKEVAAPVAASQPKAEVINIADALAKSLEAIKARKGAAA